MGQSVAICGAIFGKCDLNLHCSHTAVCIMQSTDCRILRSVTLEIACDRTLATPAQVRCIVRREIAAQWAVRCRARPSRSGAYSRHKPKHEARSASRWVSGKSLRHRMALRCVLHWPSHLNSLVPICAAVLTLRSRSNSAQSRSAMRGMERLDMSVLVSS